jgi:hypothetical protein
VAALVINAAENFDLSLSLTSSMHWVLSNIANVVCSCLEEKEGREGGGGGEGGGGAIMEPL